VGGGYWEGDRGGGAEGPGSEDVWGEWRGALGSGTDWRGG